MPQEQRKRGRGRRGQEKEKKGKLLDELQARAQEEGRPSKRLRLSPPRPVESEIVLDTQGDTYEAQHTYDVYDASETREQIDARPESQFFGHLDDAEQIHLKHGDLTLQNESFTSPEEKAHFLENFWTEIKGKELKIACSQSCSRILERLFRQSTAAQLKTSWNRIKGNFLTLVQHRFASHCVEALFVSSAPIVSRELLDDEKPTVATEEHRYEDDEVLASKTSMEALFTDVVKELQNNLGYLLTDKFASHTLRVLLVVLSGKPLSSSRSLLQSKKKENALLTNSASTDTSMAEQRVVPESFNNAFTNMVSDTIYGLDTNYLRALATNPLANPVLQLILELELAAGGKQKAKDDKSLFRRLLPDDPPSEGTQSAAFVKGLLYDSVGSRLLETLIQSAPGKNFKAIYVTLFKGNLASIVRNETASFVVIKVIERLSKDELEGAVKEIVPQFTILFERSRLVVIKSLIERCRIRGLTTLDIADALVESLGPTGQHMLVKLLQPSEENRGNMSEDRQLALDRNPTKMHASLLGQVMLAQSDPLQQLLLNSLSESEPSFLTKLAKDSSATYVVQAALKADQVDRAARKVIAQKFQSYIVELAAHPIGSRVVDALRDGTNGLHFLRERFAEDIWKHQSELKETRHGQAVCRNWQIDLYERRRSDWAMRMKSQSSSDLDQLQTHQHQEKAANEIGVTRTRFTGSNAKTEPHHKPQTSIEAARARFAARKKKNPRSFNSKRQQLSQAVS